VNLEEAHVADCVWKSVWNRGWPWWSFYAKLSQHGMGSNQITLCCITEY